MFRGFPQTSIQFLKDLEANNNKEWFTANKPVYQSELLAPAKEFVEVMGERLHQISPSINYDTRTNGSGSLMRIYRDVRFSKDKTPYKTAVAGMFWEGEGKKTQNPGFGFQLTKNGIGLVAGMFGFDKHKLNAYREAVDDDKLGSELAQLVADVTADGTYSVHHEHYKKVPRGYDADHPRATLMKFNSLYVHPTTEIGVEEIGSAELIDICYDHFAKMAPIQQWLVKIFS